MDNVIGEVTQLSVSLPNKPGVLLKYTDVLRTLGVNILGLMTKPDGDNTLVNIITADYKLEIIDNLKGKGYVVTHTPAFYVDLPGTVGSLHGFLGGFVKDVNIIDIFGTQLVSTSTIRIFFTVTTPGTVRAHLTEKETAVA